MSADWECDMRRSSRARCEGCRVIAARLGSHPYGGMSVSDPGDARPSPPVLVDTLSYPREFSFSLVFSLALHLAFVAVLLQGGRLPTVETVRDVFLTPDWTVAPAVRDP